MRNALGTLKVFKDRNEERIQWKFIENLQEVQTFETLVLANKLGRKHIEWKKQIMKVHFH